MAYDYNRHVGGMWGCYFVNYQNIQKNTLKVDPIYTQIPDQVSKDLNSSLLSSCLKAIHGSDSPYLLLVAMSLKLNKLAGIS